MAKKKYSYYVAYVNDEGLMRFITSVDYRNKTWIAKAGENALEMTLSSADDLVLGMLLNYVYAFTVKVPNGIGFHNPAVEREESKNE